MTSVHANSAWEALVKLTTLPLLAGENVSHRFILPTVAATIDLIVFLRGDGWGAAPGRGGPGGLRPGRGGPGRGRPGVSPGRRPPPVDRRVPAARRALPPPRLRARRGPGHMNVDDVAVLAIPAVLVTGLMLLGLGFDGRTREARRSWRRVGRF